MGYGDALRQSAFAASENSPFRQIHAVISLYFFTFSHKLFNPQEKWGCKHPS